MGRLFGGNVYNYSTTYYMHNLEIWYYRFLIFAAFKLKNNTKQTSIFSSSKLHIVMKAKMLPDEKLVQSINSINQNILHFPGNNDSKNMIIVII